MSSCVAELDGILQSMLELKPPGVSGPKITAITSLCTANVQSETVLIQKIYTHFKKAPGDKKLGVLYVVDSVTRQWLEQARKAGQPIGSTAADGSFAAGVKNVTALLPSFMNDIINTAPEPQKAKISKLVDIWERGNTFPAAMLSNFKERLNAPASNAVGSTTPGSTPPQNFASLNAQVQKATGSATDTSAILANLQALANMAKQNPATQPVNPAQVSSSNVTFPQNAFSSVNPAAGQAVNVPGALNGVFSYPGMNGLQQAFAQNPSNGQPIVPAVSQPQGSSTVTPEALQQQLQILSALKAQGVPEQQWAAVLSVLMASGQAAPAPAAAPAYGGGFGGDQSRDRNGYRSPPRGSRNRSRSRSPNAWDRRREASPPRRRDSPVYGEYSGDRNGGRGGRGYGGDENRRGGASTRGSNNPYRQRSPERRRSPSPRPDQTLPAPGQKYIVYDPSIDEGKIKVLSRTLFVGGVTSSEESLRKIFASFGRVQTCIVNVDKRHAFVKMITRDEAVMAKDGMEHYKSAEMQLRTRWGVGFGPRDCSDYQTGISIIPIDRLTDADRKWLLTADFGGTGGKTIDSRMVVEEPDIEIGAGVSSKAISRRMQTDKSGQQGPRSTREPPAGGSGSGGSRYRQPERTSSAQENNNSIGVPPAVPGFGFSFPMMPNGMPMFPPGFVMPGSMPTQPPPPGAG